MIDRELHSVDVLLADLRGDSCRLAARRVANCETPATFLKSIAASGWLPIDTSIRIGDVPALIRNLGGEALYGPNQMVPVRELIQNAGDAVRLRKAIQPDIETDKKSIIVRLGKESGRNFLEVEDHGVGMDADAIQTKLLNFGNSGWNGDPIFSDYPSAIFPAARVSGKFGIGFFSVFMISSKVEVTTRRFDKAFSDTLHLVFNDGVINRPILSNAAKSNWLMEGGTLIRIWLDDDELIVKFKIGQNEKQGPVEILSSLFPSFDIPIKVTWPDGEGIVDGSKWLTEPAEILIRRVVGSDRFMKYANNIRPIFYRNGSVAGRLCLCREDNGRMIQRRPPHAAITVNGSATTSMSNFLGIVDGQVSRAARDVALPKLTADEWLPWLSEQAMLLKRMNLKPDTEVELASVIGAIGGNPNPLFICHAAGQWLSPDGLTEFVKGKNEISVTSFHKLSIGETKGKMDVDPNVIFVDGSTPAIFQSGTSYNRRYDPFWSYPAGVGDRSMEALVVDIIGDVWNVDKEMLRSYVRDTIDGMYGRYDRLIKIGELDDKPIFDFAHVISRSLSRDDFPAIAALAERDRLTSGDFAEYFGEDD